MGNAKGDGNGLGSEEKQQSQKGQSRARSCLSAVISTAGKVKSHLPYAVPGGGEAPHLWRWTQFQPEEKNRPAFISPISPLEFDRQGPTENRPTKMAAQAAVLPAFLGTTSPPRDSGAALEKDGEKKC